jgi:hypothetical protein
MKSGLARLAGALIRLIAGQSGKISLSSLAVGGIRGQYYGVGYNVCICAAKKSCI